MAYKTNTKTSYCPVIVVTCNSGLGGAAVHGGADAGKEHQREWRRDDSDDARGAESRLDIFARL